MGCEASTEVYHTVPVQEEHKASKPYANQEAPVVNQEIKVSKAMNAISI